MNKRRLAVIVVVCVVCAPSICRGLWLHIRDDIIPTAATVLIAEPKSMTPVDDGTKHVEATFEVPPVNEIDTEYRLDISKTFKEVARAVIHNLGYSCVDAIYHETYIDDPNLQRLWLCLKSKHGNERIISVYFYGIQHRHVDSSTSVP